MTEKRFVLVGANDPNYTVFTVNLIDNVLHRKHLLYGGPKPPRPDRIFQFELQRDRFEARPAESYQLRPWRPLDV